MTPDTSLSNKAMALKLPELKPDEAIVAPIRIYATNLVIKTQEGYLQAAQRLVDLKAEIDRVEAEKDSVFKPINAGLRAFSALVKRALDPLLAHEVAIKTAMIRYSDEQDRIRREEQRRANEAAEKERKRLEAAAERNRAKGNEARAEDFAERASMVVAPVAQQRAPEVKGIAIPLVWDFEIVDEKLVPMEWRDISEVRIRRQVMATKGDTQIPGVMVKQIRRIAAGRA